MNHEQIVWLSERYKTRTFKSESEARTEVLDILIYLARTSRGVRDLSASERRQEKERALTVPLYQTPSGWKVGIRARTRVAKPKFSWDQLTIKRNSIADLTANGYVNLFDSPRLGPVKIARLDGLTLTEGNKDQAFIAATAQAIKDHDKTDFLAIVVDDEGNLIDGHHRWFIAKALGMKTVPVQVVTYAPVANPRRRAARRRR